MSNGTVGKLLVQVLRQAGAARVNGVVSDGLNPFVDTIRTAEGIRRRRKPASGEPSGISVQHG